MSEVKVNKISPRSGTTVTLGDSGDTFTVPSGATFDASNATTTLPSTVVTTTGTQTLTNKTIDASQLTDATVTPAKLNYNYNQYRNIVINGDMNIAQRGTSVSSISSGSAYNTIDRMRFGVNSLGTWTQSQSTDVPTGQGFAKSFKLDCTTADASPGASDYLFLNYNIEGQDLQYLKKGTANAESLTLSFWTKSNKTGTYTFELDDNDNNRSISQTYTIDSASTWEKKTITLPGDTTGTLDNDNNTSLRFYFWLGAGSNYTSGTLQTSWQSTTDANRVSSSNVNLADNTANEWYITGVQLEAGTTASDFEFLPYDVNLRRCQRYYQTMTLVRSGSYYASSAAPVRSGQTTLPTYMRTDASITFSSQSINNGTGLTLDGTDEGHFNTYITANGAGTFYWEANVVASAEL